MGDRTRDEGRSGEGARARARVKERGGEGEGHCYVCARACPRM